MKYIPKRVWVVFQKNWGQWEVVGTATTIEQRKALAKQADYIPGSGQTKWLEFQATGEEGGPFE